MREREGQKTARDINVFKQLCQECRNSNNDSYMCGPGNDVQTSIYFNWRVSVNCLTWESTDCITDTLHDSVLFPWRNFVLGRPPHSLVTTETNFSWLITSNVNRLLVASACMLQTNTHTNKQTQTHTCIHTTHTLTTHTLHTQGEERH